jgi:cytochrome c553
MISGSPLAASAVALILAGAAGAQPPAPVQAGAVMCIACHGASGQGGPSGVPRLAGQNADYMAHALAMFKAGTRQSAIMQPIAQSLSDPRIRVLADFFSVQHAPAIGTDGVSQPQLLVTGKRLAQLGAANVAACFSCHAPEGLGNGIRFPRIAGEPQQFVIDRLHEFQARAHQAAPKAGTMTAVAATMSESQIEAAAAYLGQLQR